MSCESNQNTRQDLFEYGRAWLADIERLFAQGDAKALRNLFVDGTWCIEFHKIAADGAYMGAQVEVCQSYPYVTIDAANGVVTFERHGAKWFDFLSPLLVDSLISVCEALYPR